MFEKIKHACRKKRSGQVSNYILIAIGIILILIAAIVVYDVSFGLGSNSESAINNFMCSTGLFQC